MSAALHTSQVSFFRSILDAGISTGSFTPELDSTTIARALVALADSYGLQMVFEERGLNRDTAAAETLRIAASLLNVSAGLDLERLTAPS